jgi:hypothetical protein
MEFSEEIGFWSVFTFWYVAINTIVTGGFLLVVIVGGFFDLKFLFKALREAQIDETDDGRVIYESEQQAESK